MSRHFTRTDTSVSTPPPTALHFTVLLSATRKGARLARLLATERLHTWGLPHDTAALVIAELAANAALHGRVPGRNFRLTLAVAANGPAATLRIEVRDPRTERLPAVRRRGETDGESGHGLLLVEELADRWGCGARADLQNGVGRTHFQPNPALITQIGESTQLDWLISRLARQARS